MGLLEIKVVECGSEKRVFVDGIEQKRVLKVETEVLPGEITTVKISYYVDKFEVIREEF